ncbi:MAG TPA: hypothetical protein VGV87_01635 [Blastocatellia bacterium]|jgi:hypothetical protein|nr:hypothetical protein [Blastocatellia bacterium]
MDQVLTLISVLDVVFSMTSGEKSLTVIVIAVSSDFLALQGVVV